MGGMNLYDAAERYRTAVREWAEEFLRQKMGPPPRGQQSVTDGQARAMADIAVDLMGARLDWEVVKARFDYTLALISAGAGDPAGYEVIEGGDDADQPA